MGLLLGQLDQFDIYAKQRLLLAILVHDYGHRGMANKLPNTSHEAHSIELLKASPLMNLAAKDIAYIEECILGTLPDQVTLIGKAYLQDPLDLKIYGFALVNDADIATSFIPSLGAQLTKLIMIEQGALDPTSGAIREAYATFTSRAKIYTQVASKALGLKT